MVDRLTFYLLPFDFNLDFWPPVALFVGPLSLA
jgi:hypothetical protein